MTRLWIPRALGALLMLGVASAQLSVPPPQVAASYGKLPLAFEPNVGQIDGQVRFVSRGGGMTAFFTDTETVMVLSRSKRRDPKAAPVAGREPAKVERAVVRMKLRGTRQPQRAIGLEKLRGTSNYFVGNDPTKWRTDVPHYARIEYEGVYPGVDLVWYGNQRQLEYDFVVTAGADPKQIQVAYEGVESVEVEPGGELVLRTALGELRQQAPRVYQDIGGKRVEVEAHYAIAARNRVSFELASYDRKRELRIDPVVLVYSTYLGGSSRDGATSIAVDAAGSAYITGSTDSTDFPLQSPYQTTLQGGGDAFVTKLTPSGDNLVYSTYFGAVGGWDQSNGIAVDGAGAAYLTGVTSSSDFPTRSAYQATYKGGEGDAFVAKLSPTGALVYSTYLGGSGQDRANGIAVDGAGSAYVTGYTYSTDFPTQSAYQATIPGAYWYAFITKLTPAGDALVYSTYLGGNGTSSGQAIAVDSAGSAYVTGDTVAFGTSSFPTQSPYQSVPQGSQDAFVTKLTPAGNALVYSTFLGGSDLDEGDAIAVDQTGSAYVSGRTTSTNFPTQSPYQSVLHGSADAFVTKLTPAGKALVYSTYLGGSADDSGAGIAVDKAGSAYVTGMTSSTDFPTASPYQETLQGSPSAFVTKLTPAGSGPIYSTYTGGSGGAWGYGIVLDNAGAAYITGTTGTGFPTQLPYQPSNHGGWDVFVTKLRLPVATPVLTVPTSGATGVSRTPTLSWSASIGATSYDVHLGTANPPPLATNTTGTSYSPGTLAAGATYYWQVVAKDSFGTASSVIWSFATQVALPTAPVLTSPANGASGVLLTPTLVWTPSVGATSYTVYFGTAAAPPLVTNTAGTSYIPATLTAGTLYYWRVVAKNPGGSNTSATWSFTMQVPPPPAPVLTSPANGATGVSVAAALAWNASSWATSYDVYFGTAAAPPLVTNTTGMSYVPATLTAATIYYWRVVAKNGTGSNTSATWSFTTQVSPPPAPVLTAPANGATDVSATPALTWNASTGAMSYDVYFGTPSSPALVTNTTGTSYTPATLTAATTYCWRVVAKNASGSNTSVTWSFTTQVSPPLAPILTAPANGATGVLVAATLTWSASSGATSYDVYFGTAASPPLLTNTTGTSYSPATLTAGTIYYWRIAAKNAGGSNTSATWSFTTQVLPPAAPAQTSPANGAGGVLVSPTLVWSPSAGATSYDVYFGAAASPSQVTSTAGTSYAPGTLSPQTTYYWRIVAQNSAGSGSSPTWEFTTGTPAAGLAFVPVTPCRVVDTRYPAGAFGAPTMTTGTSRSFAVPRSVCGIPNTAQAYSLNVTVVPKGPLSFLTLWPTGEGQPLVSTLNSFGGAVVANAAIVPAGTNGAVSVFVTDTTDVILDINGYFDTSSGSTSYSFYPAPPCRVADTRGQAGQFDGPSMHADEGRDFPIPLSACGIPAAARGYSLNVTVVPPGVLSYLTLWPTGQDRPLVSTLNSWTGKVVANAAIVPAGTNESISVFVTHPTDVILDGNGYFAAPGGTGGLSFYPVTPCRVADTRNDDGPFGGPEMDAGTTRSFAIPASVCNVPSNAAAYSVNVTAVPEGRLSYLSAWPAASPRPNVSTLNSWDGSVVANAAIVPAGDGGAISIFVTDETHVILDINGYFAP